ncbi:hypothetical protein C7B61_13460 [filamentous cyanobacterium CCP1]|nr:hypothetical protein C7B76_24740 [filamentous cyanobacterium CCP2]PSB63342.1 hypothetical protein C7B61_13460 [filamentous cyanobacterium CCP1]
MPISDADSAVVDIRKLCDYCLNLKHEDGRHKAQLFSSILGITADNANVISRFTSFIYFAL